ncbi:stress-induced receptor-like kinase [Trifolium pratense]|uniref:Stress-induced receptor-like kinase n=1 Tax=Trifolium pratense TaxID=57577 RepID=A0A2K3MFK8_TRIPR|nr:stress-induced receptor-like kinase [Trifolium pratense]
MKPVDRPSMKKVVEMLEGDIENIEMPPKPLLYPAPIFLVRALKKLIYLKNPDLLFLMETTRKELGLFQLRNEGGLDNMVVVGCDMKGKGEAYKAIMPHFSCPSANV